ncbi:MAG: hypothetical protein LH618_07790, partial [Saprospiraceae bacterium]|nr:hypothetical protein [Saprospiraceae bacterium]
MSNFNTLSAYSTNNTRFLELLIGCLAVLTGTLKTWVLSRTSFVAETRPMMAAVAVVFALLGGQTAVYGQIDANTQCELVHSDDICTGTEYPFVLYYFGTDNIPTSFEIIPGTTATISRGTSQTPVTITAQVRQAGYSTRKATLTLTLSGYSTSGSPHEGACDGGSTANWKYYNSWTGNLIGESGTPFAGLNVSFSRGSYPPFQIGYGASTGSPSSDYGISSWMVARVNSLPSSGQYFFQNVGQDRQSDFEADIVNCSSNCTVTASISGNNTICSG